MFYLIYPLLWLLGWLPLWLLHRIADIIYPVLYYVLRYRVKVVRTNLKNAFPDKSDKERRRIERRFYLHLCDYGVETLWLMHASKKAMQRHFRFENIDLLYQYGARQDKNIIALFGHYGNWEWVSSIPLAMDGSMSVGTLYKPLRNKGFDRMFIRLRQRFETRCIDKNRVLRSLATMMKEPQRFVLAFIADQTPSGRNIHYWEPFLNQDTPFLSGWASIAKRSNASVVFLEITKQRRGYYVGRVELFCEHPELEEEQALVARYVRRMEQNILVEPSFWLWSHKRWKHKR